MAQAATKKMAPVKTLEQTLWDAADKMRGNLEAGEARRAEIIEDRNEYAADNVFWVPTEARWGFLQDRAKQPEIGVLIDHAMDLVETDNPQLKGVLPKSFARAEIDKRLLGELVDLHRHDWFHQGRPRRRRRLRKGLRVLPRTIRLLRRQARRRVLHASLGGSTPGRDARALPRSYL